VYAGFQENKKAVDDFIHTALKQLLKKHNLIGDDIVVVLAGNFNEDPVWVQLNGKNGFIDATGKEVIPLKYDKYMSFSEGMAGAVLDGKAGFIDTVGKEVIPFKYDAVWNFSEGLACVRLAGKWGIIDAAGREVIPCKYDVDVRFSEGLANVKSAGKWGFIDAAGRQIIPFKYDDADCFREGMARVGFTKPTGIEYTQIDQDTGEYEVVAETANEYGYIDLTGAEVIPAIYDDADYFSKGKAWVKLNGEEFFINHKGERI
jgi:hypothetical protein